MSRSSRTLRTLLGLIVLVLLAAKAQAGTLYWDPSGTASIQGGGTGTWATSSGTWYDGVSSDVNWTDNTGTDTAVFGGTTPGTVTIGSGGVTANSLILNTAGYLLAGGNLTLAGTTPTITANANGTIGSVIAGSAGLNMTGAGVLTLSGNNTYTGTTAINNGTLALSGAIAAGSTISVGNGTAGGGGALQLAQGGVNSNTLVLNGGTVLSVGTAAVVYNEGSGGTITLSGGNVIHTFTATGTSSLVLPMAETAQVLVVGGGGGGGNVGDRTGGGGGGGGVLYNSSDSLGASTYAVTVGAGGASETNGGSSVFGSMTAYGGGGGADNSHLQAGTGNGTVGSGGGAYHNNSSHLGVGTTGQGNSGGSGYDSGDGSKYFFAGGGGGAGAAGTSANSSTSGAGGNGVSYSISGAAVYYGGGGGGGVQNNGSYSYAAASGGLGGGGTGGVGGGAGSTTAAVAGTNGLGGGGGGAGNSGTGAAGGSGTVIVSYPQATTGQVTLSGAITVPVTSTLDALLNGNQITVNSAMSGAGGINIASSIGTGGVVSYAVPQGYSGGTTVNANATLQLGASNAVPYGANTGNVSVNGTLDLNGQATTNVNGLSGSGLVTSSIGGSSSLVVGNNAATSTFTGVVQNGNGTVGLTVAGPGQLTLTGANTYTGGTAINQGVLQIGNGSVNGTIGSGAYNIASGAKLYLNYATATGSDFPNITGSGTLEINCANSGEWSNNALPAGGFTGTIQIDNGNLWDGQGSANAIIVNNGGRFAAAGASTFTQHFTIAGTGIADGYAEAIRLWGGPTLSGEIDLSASATIGSDSVGGTLSGVITGPSGATLTIGTGGNLQPITLSGASSNTYAGTTAVAAGTLILSKTGGAVAVPGNLTMANNTTVTQSQPNQLASTSTVTVNATNGNWARLSLDGNNLTIAGITDAGGAVIQNGPSGVTAPANATLTMNLSTTNNNISGYLRNNDNGSSATTLGLTVNGNGMLTLSGGNITYSGATNVSGGTLVFSGAVNNNSSIAMANGANLTFNATGSESFTQSITGAAGNVTFNVAGDTSPTGGGSPTNFSLQNTGAFTGTVVINTGLVAPSADSAFGNAANVIQLNAASGASAGMVATGNVTLPSTRSIQLMNAGGNSIFRAYGSTTFEIDGVISGPGNLVSTDSGTIKLVGDNTYTGNTTIGDADLDLVGGGQLGGGNYAGTINGSGGLYVNITGTQVLTGSNTYSGGTELYGGTLQVNAMSGIGTGYLGIKGGDFRYMGTGSETSTRPMWDDQLSGGTIEIVNAGATLTLTPASGTVDNNLTKAGAGTLVFAGIGISGGNVTVNAGNLTLVAGNIKYGGATSVSGGTLQLQDTTSFASAVNVGNSGTLNLVRSSTGFANRSAIAGNNITGTGVINVNNAGSGISGGWIVANAANAMNFSGTININSGVFGTDGSGGGGVIQGTATVNIASGGVFTNHASSGVTIGALNGSGDVTPAQGGGGTYNLTVGNGGASGTFSGIIHGNNSTGGSDGTIEAGYLSFTKTGSGVEVLTGANTYTGATTVNGGTLAIGNGGSGSLGGGNYAASIANNAALVFNTTQNQILGGAISGNGSLTQSGGSVLTLSGNNASYSGPVSVSGGTLELANVAAAPAGSAVAVGPSAALTLDAAGGTLSSLSVANASTLVLPSTGATGTALTNALAFVSTPSLTVKPVLGSVPSLGGTYNLITGGAAVSGTPGTITTDLSAYAPTRVTGTTAVVGNNLVFTVVTGPANLVWNNAADNSTWDLNTSPNFNNGGTADVFQTFDSVTFDDSTTPGTVALSGNLQAGVVTVNNSTGNYTFTGPGSITGPGSLVKSGTAALIMTTANSYTGGTSVNQGTLQLGTGTANVSMGSGAYSIANGGTLLLYSNNATTYGANWGNITGAGTLALNTAGSGTGSGDWGALGLPSAFTGTLQIGSGRAFAPSAGAGLGGATTVVVNAGGQFGDWVGGTYNQNFIIAGSGYGESGYGVAIRGGSSTATVLNGNVTLTAATALGSSNNLQLNGTLAGGGNQLTIGDSSQTGTVTLNGSSSTSLGGISLNYGTLAIGASGNVSCGGISGPGGVRAGLSVAAGGVLTATSFGTSYNVTQFNINGTASLGNVTFSVAANPTMTGSGVLNVSSLTVHNWTGLSDSMTGGTMNVGSGGIVNSGDGTNTFTIGATTIGATAPWSSSMAMGLSDATTGATFDTTGGDITLSGGLYGSGALHKAGPGTLTLSGASSYAGFTNVNAGTLSLTAAISGSSAVTVASGALLTTNCNNSFSAAPAGAWAISGTIQGTANAQTMPASVTLNNGTMSGNAFAGWGTFFASVPTTITANGAGNTISAGNLGLGSTLTLNTPQTTDAVLVSAALGATSANGGGLATSGSGLVTLTASNTYTGPTTVNAGTLQLGNGGTSGSIDASSGVAVNGTLAFNRANNFTFALPITGTGGVNQLGPGAVTLSGTSTYTGPTAISAGTLAVSGALGNTAVTVGGGAALGGIGTIAGPVTVASGAATANQGTISLVDGTIGTLTLSNAGTALTLGNGLGTSVMDFEIGAGGASDLLALSSGSLAVNGPTVLNFTELTTPTIGTYNLITYQSATGTNNFQLGSLALASSLAATLTATGGTEQLIITPGTPPQAYWQGPGTTWSTAGNWTSDTLGLHTLTRLPGSSTDLFFATTGGTATIDENFNVNSLNLASSNSVTVSGTNTLTLLAAAGTGLTDNGAAAHTIAAPLALGTAQAWTVSGAAPLTVSGVISDAPGSNGTGLMLTGGGSVIFTGANTYTGGTTVDTATTLQLGDGVSSNGSLAGNIADNGLVTFANPTAQSFSGTISGTGGVVAGGSGTLTFNTAHSYTGGTTVVGGATLQLGDGLTQNGSVTGNVVDNGLLALANPSTQTFSGAISGTGGVVKSAGGLLTLTSPASSYSGGTTVLGGTLQYGANNALPTAGNVTVNGGQLDLATFSGTVGSVTLTSGAITGNTSGFPVPVLTASGFNVSGGTVGVTLAGTDPTVGLTKTGPGTAVLSAANLCTGLTDIQQGTLQCTAGGIFGGDVQIGQSATAAALDVEANLYVGNVTLVNGAITSANGSTLSGYTYNVQSGIVGVSLGDQGGTPLVKSGSGTVVLSGNNSYTGGTSVEGGVLSISGSSNLGPGNLSLGAGTLQTTGAYTLDTGTVTLTDPTAGIDTPLFTDDVTLGGVITGTGGLNKTGPGTLELAGAAGTDYSGDTTVLAGTLLADAANALSPASNLVIGDGASVILNFGGATGNDSIGGFTAGVPQFAAPTLATPALSPAGISTVPEPGTGLLLLVGALGGFLLVRKNR